MNAIHTAYINALLADAVYVTDIKKRVIEANDFKDRLTPTQSTYLAANFTVVTSIETPNTIHSELGTGFDAVVWQIKAGSELAGPNNVNAGKLFVSMRGTQGGTDIADDGTLATRGIPYDQIRDMVNWWLKNTAAVTNTQVQQIKVIEAPGLVGAKTFALDTPTNGTGLLNELDGIAGVNGHSLGGYLSTAFARIFGAAWGVEQVSTFNSAGFRGNWGQTPITGSQPDGKNMIAPCGRYKRPAGRYDLQNGHSATPGRRRRPRCGPAVRLPRRSAPVGLRPAHDVVGGAQGAGATRHFHTALEQRQRGDAADVEARRQVLMVLGVDLGHPHPRLQLGGGLLEGRGHHAARAAPRRPEVHQHRDLAAADVAVKGGFVQRDRRAGEQRPVAAAAVGLIRQVVGVDAVGGVAVWTDDVQRFTHGSIPLWVSS